MSVCCSPRDYERSFDTGQAKRDASRYRKKGLDSTARRMVALLAARGVEGSSVLEVGGGIGDLQLELLKAGAARATSVELSPSYEPLALELAREAGLEDRIERRIFDFAAEPDAVADADIVAMHSVICCYPDMERLVSAAAGKARRTLIMSYPRELGLLSDLWRWISNAYDRFKGSSLRFYVHSPAAIVATAEAAGMRLVHQEHGWIFHLALLERISSAGPP